MSLDEGKAFTFKLYVFKNQEENEIRKFGLKTNELSFEKMEETLKDIFPSNQSKFTLLWKDQENDMITLSSSREFSTFVEHILKSSDEEVKLYLNIESELFSISKKFENCDLNVNYTCKTCKKAIIPKCLDCTKQNLPQERKILNIVDKSSSNINRADDKNDGKTVNTVNTLSTVGTIPNNSKRSHFSFGMISPVNLPSNSENKGTSIFGSAAGTSTNLFK